MSLADTPHLPEPRCHPQPHRHPPKRLDSHPSQLTDRPCPLGAAARMLPAAAASRRPGAFQPRQQGRRDLLRAGPDTSSVHRATQPTSGNSAVSRHWFFGAVGPRTQLHVPDPRLFASSAVRDDESAGHTGIRVQVPYRTLTLCACCDFVGPAADDIEARPADLADREWFDVGTDHTLWRRICAAAAGRQPLSHDRGERGGHQRGLCRHLVDRAERALVAWHPPTHLISQRPKDWLPDGEHHQPHN